MFSREESQKIDSVLEIYHHCFFFNKVGKAIFFFFLDCVFYVSVKVLSPLWF